jgi:hypothetical protein
MAPSFARTDGVATSFPGTAFLDGFRGATRKLTRALNTGAFIGSNLPTRRHYFQFALSFAIIQNGSQRHGVSPFSSEAGREKQLFEWWRELVLPETVELGQGSPAE